MLELAPYISGGVVGLCAAVLAWLYSVIRNNVNVVDSLWSIMFLLIALTYVASAETLGWRAPWIAALCAIWALRLSLHLSWRNYGKPEDHRYQAIRRNHSPGFAWKSLYIVFGLQAALAWIISLPLVAAAAGTATPGWLDVLGLALWLIGMGFESLADWQLARFKTHPGNRGRVLDSGLWRYSRHPNYFGEACIWWGFYCLAAAAGAWWALPAPIIMTMLLLKVSGVSLLEKDISDRRPAYREYIRQTNAFIPGPPRRSPEHSTAERRPCDASS